MDNTHKYAESQEKNDEMLHIPSSLHGFRNITTTTREAKSGRTVFCLEGEVEIPEEERICACGCHMHVHNKRPLTLRHLYIGGNLSCVTFQHYQLRCPECGATKMQYISFMAPGHRITAELYQYTIDLLARGTYTNKQIAEITGLGKNTVKSIDLKRLKEKYTEDGDKLMKPEKTTRYLSIDEFKLHDGYKFATHIIDMETGHILWIAHGKKKQVVYDFIEHVGQEWMSHVEAVACDMNSDFEEAFKEKCPHIQPVYDHFHIIKNFNDKVVSAIRRDEQRRLSEEGDEEGAASLKKTRYILTSKRQTLQGKDEDAQKGKVISRESALFNIEAYIRKEGHEARYDELLAQNKLFFICDLMKERLALAYSRKSKKEMAIDIIELLKLCFMVENEHFKWFARMLYDHFYGIIAYATYRISSGMIEGINNKIKTLRRQAYGYPDDEYFFLKLFDLSRSDYTRNEKSHKVCD